MIYENVLKAVGNTPLIKLDKFTPKGSAQIFAKAECLNVGGSIKTRTALNMIESAENEGLISPNKSIIVEPTSGNQGIGLALVGAVKGYKTIIIMPDSVSNERQKLASLYGAKIIAVHDDGDIGKCIKKCIDLAYDLKRKNPNVFFPNQFENAQNVNAHFNFTATEIIDDLNGLPIHGFVAGIGTGGTITGVGKALKQIYPNLVIWTAEPENSAILSGSKSTNSHLQMGIGDGLIPPILDRDVFSKVCVVSDKDAIFTAREVAKTEGIACGISSGTNLFVAKQLAKQLGEGKTVVTILPDTAERYYSTPLFL